jgi:hypothetical protein
MSPGVSLPVVCIHEDRSESLIGVKLTVLSLARHAPRLRVLVSCPGAGAEFAAWLEAQPNASRVQLTSVRGTAWNIKPSVLLELLDSHPDVVWLDSDIIVAGDIEVHLVALSPDVIVTAEETYWGQRQGDDFRTSAWGLESTRTFACTMNTGVLRVTREHIDMLEAWQAMLAHPAYLRAQAGPWYERPLHMLGDQEALTGLLGSAEFAHLPVSFLQRGSVIAQCFGPAGFTPAERVGALLRGGPALIHAMGPKPWLRPSSHGGPAPSKDMLTSMREWYGYLTLDVSPYCIEARRYVGEPGLELGWAEPVSAAGRLLCMVGGGRPAAPGLPIAVVDHVARWIRKMLGIARYPQSQDTFLKERPF